MRVSKHRHYHAHLFYICLVGGLSTELAQPSLAALATSNMNAQAPTLHGFQGLMAASLRQPRAFPNAQTLTLHNPYSPFLRASYPQSVVATGITWPPRFSRGYATIELQPASDPSLAEFYPYSTLYGVEVTVGDELAQFVVDTGASNSVLSEVIAETMALPSTPVPRERVESFVVGEHCSEQNLNLYQLPPIIVDQAQVEGISALGLPFSTNPTQTAGVLGMDFLSEFDVILDAGSQEMHLRPPSDPEPTSIPLLGQIGLMTAGVMVNADGPFSFMLDTGASLTVLAQDLVQRMNLDLSQAQPIEVVGFCGTEAGQYLRLNQIALGSHLVRDLDVIILDSPVLDALNVDGILGQNFLSRYRQHWRFDEPDADGFPRSGSLDLRPIQRSLQK